MIERSENWVIHIKKNVHAYQGRIQDFKLGGGGGGAHLKKLRRAEGGTNIFGVFRVKNHDFTQKNHIFSNCGGRRENVWGISCEKSRFTPRNPIFSNFSPPPPPLPLDPPLHIEVIIKIRYSLEIYIILFILGLIIIIYSILFYSILFEKKKWSLEELNKNVYIKFSAYDAFLCTCMLSDNQFNSIVY